MPSTVVQHLAALPEAELRQMQSKVEADLARIERDRATVAVELEQITEALARQSRPAAKSKGGRRPTRPGATQKRILDAVARLPQPVSPAEIIAEMESHGPAGNRGTIHNAIGRLVKTSRLVKIDVGQYQLASRNGIRPDAFAGPSENGASEPPLTATQPQEAS